MTEIRKQIFFAADDYGAGLMDTQYTPSENNANNLMPDQNYFDAYNSDTIYTKV